MDELDKMRRTAAGSSPARPTKSCSSWTPLPARTASSRPASSPSPPASPASSSPKLDGTAKGGIAVAIARELNLPVRFAGVGEKMDDLLEFSPEAFVDSLLE